MPDPAIRLRILVAPDGSSTVAGVEKVVAPIRKAVKDASQQATQDLDKLGQSIEKIIRRVQGFTKTSSGQRFFNLKDVVGSLDSIDTRLTKLAGKGFGGLNKSFKDLNSSLADISKQLDAIAKKMGAIGTQGARAANQAKSASKKALTGIDPALEQNILDAIAGKVPTGAATASVTKKGIVGLVQQFMADGARVAYNARSGSYRVSLPNDLQRDEALKLLRASLAGATPLGIQTLMRTATGPVTREGYALPGAMGKAYLYPDARNPYIRYQQDDSAARAAASAAALATRNKDIQDRLTSEHFAPSGKAFEQISEAGVSLVREFKNASGAVAQFDEKLGKLTIRYPADNTAATAAAQAKAAAFLSANGFAGNEVGRRLQMGPNGTRTLINYKNDRGGTASLVEETGQLSAKLPAATSLLTKMGDAVAGIGKGFVSTFRDVGVSVLDKLAHPVQTATSFFLKLGGVIYTLRNSFRMLEAVTVTPFKAMLSGVTESTERYREFEVAISGVVGGMSRAKVVNDALVQASRNLPMTAQDLQDVAREMAYMGPLTSQIATGTNQEAAQKVADFSKLVNKLAIYDPQQGVQGVMIALREGMAGELRSLRTRLELPLEQVAKSINKSQHDLAGNPTLLLKALQTWTEQYIPDSALAERGRLYSVQMDKVREAVSNASATIGESGVFDKLVDMLIRFREGIYKYTQSSDWITTAQHISDSLGRTLDNLATGLLKFIHNLAGGGAADDTAQAVGKALEGIFGKFESWSQSLPEIGKKLGEFSQAFISTISDIVSAIRTAAYELNRPKASWVPFTQARGDYLKQQQLAGYIGTSRFFGSLGITADAEKNTLNTSFHDLLMSGHPISMDSSKEWVAFPTLPGRKAMTPVQENTLREMYHKVREAGSFDVGTGTLNNPEEMWEKLQEWGYSGFLRTLAKERREQDIAYIQQLRSGNQGLAPNGLSPVRLQTLSDELNLAREPGIDPLRDWPKGPSPVELQALLKERHLTLADLNIPMGPPWNMIDVNAGWTKNLSPEASAAYQAAFGDENKPMLEFNGRSYRMQLKSMNSALAQLGKSYNPEADPTYAVMSQAASTATTLRTDTFDKVATFRKTYSELLDTLIASLKDVIASGHPQAQEIQKILEGNFIPLRKDLDTGYQAAVEEMAQQLKQRTMEYGVGLSKTLDHLGPEAAADLYQRISEGTTGVAQAMQKLLGQVAKELLTTPSQDFGFEAMPLHERISFQAGRVRVREEMLKNAERYGGMISEGDLTSSDAAARIRDRALAGTWTGANKETLKVYEAELTDAMATFDKAQARYNTVAAQGGSKEQVDQARLAVEQAGAAIGGLGAKLRDLRISTNYVLKGFIEFGQKVEEALENSVGDALYNLITGTGTLKDALLGFARDVVRAFSQMSAHNLVAAVLGTNSVAQGGPGVLTPFFTKIFSPGSNSSNGTNWQGGDWQQSGLRHETYSSTPGVGLEPGAPAGANGAVWKGGFTPLYAFSQGGVVHRPVIGIVGEGKDPAEAMVPLPDGRSIPVTMRGSIGSETVNNIYVVNSVEEAVARGFRRNRDVLVDAIAGDVKKGGKVRKALRRPVA